MLYRAQALLQLPCGRALWFVQLSTLAVQICAGMLYSSVPSLLGESLVEDCEKIPLEVIFSTQDQQKFKLSLTEFRIKMPWVIIQEIKGISM